MYPNAFFLRESCNQFVSFKFLGIAIDWISDNLYWTDEDLGIVVVSRIDGRYPHMLMTNVGRPRGIDVNPITG